MSSALHEHLHMRFNAAFGPPSNILEKDFHWSIPAGSASLAVHVLVNGTLERPAVWVFDPHDPNSVFKTLVKDRAHLEEIILEIHGRTKRGDGQPSKS